MRLAAVALSGASLLQHGYGYATPVGSGAGRQAPLADLTGTTHQSQTSQQLRGRFLHITDLHPDPFYKVHSSPDQACHSGKGTAGIYGAETTDCDTPFSLVNETLKWIEENIKDDIDFVVWTGDSARHDSDEKLPRDADQVLSTNRWIAERFREVFRSGDDASPLPIVPTFGNNDILPHNILPSGPNKWLKAYGDIWREFIPEEQRHGFERGGWFYVEVIPNKLAVFSLNTLYFFAQNAAVDGCDSRSEPGYEHMEWLRIQLQFMRERGMKAILMGHVPPARTESKKVWDETCWQKYTLWLQQYRDVVVSSIYGHMNIDHFMLQDTKEIDLLTEDEYSASQAVRTTMDDELTVESMNSYLKELRNEWSELPDTATDPGDETFSGGKKGKKSKKDKTLRKIGGPWGERYQFSLVSPSVVPNFLPTLRIIEYNISGLDSTTVWTDARSETARSETARSETARSETARSETARSETVTSQQIDLLDEDTKLYIDNLEVDSHLPELAVGDVEESISKKKKKKGKKPKNPDFTMPYPPSKKSPPGPAYSAQTFTLLGYTQYFANLTVINNESSESKELGGVVDVDKLHQNDIEGSKDKVPKPKPFKYEVEYDTFTDPVYKLKDMTVRSYIDLAHRIGQYKPVKGDQIDGFSSTDFNEIKDNSDNDDDIDAEKKNKGKKEKQRKQREKNEVWLEFIRRAYVGALSEEELQSFQQSSEQVSNAVKPKGTDTSRYAQ